METYHREKYADKGLDQSFVQDNLSYSTMGTLRGLHYQHPNAEAILTIAGQIKERHDIPWGTYHYCGKGKTTWHGFAEKIFELAKQYDSLAIKKVIPVTTAEYPTPARRPLNSVMDCSMLINNFGISLIQWQKSLATMLSQNPTPINQTTTTTQA